jgi:hypothetical protein
MFIVAPQAEEWQEASHLIGARVNSLEPGDIFFHDDHFCEVSAFIMKNQELVGIRYVKYSFFET